ncbi:uncharacterized protein VP01_13039g1, partial [Puccinia sorghi]
NVRGFTQAYLSYHNGQSEIANKAIKQYLCQFISYHQDDWVQLLPTAEFSRSQESMKC